jgi:inner membrane protein
VASAFAHAFAAATLGAAITPGRFLPRLLLVGIVCSLLPDTDVGGFALGIRYGDLLGHRGLTHSIAFAVVTALGATALCFRGADWAPLRARIALYLFVATASHGVFDAMTNGGLGVAFFSPVDVTRYFLPFQPVEVSPIGVASFFTARSLRVLASEAVWIAIPWTVVVGAVYAAVRAIDRRGESRGNRRGISGRAE